MKSDGELRQDKAMLQGALEAANEQNDRLRSANEKNKAYVLELEAEVDRLRKQHDLLMASKPKHVAELYREVERLQNYVVDLKAENAMTLREPELIREVERLRAEVEALSSRPDWTAYNAVLDEVERRIEQVAGLVDRNNVLVTENERLRAELERILEVDREVTRENERLRKDRDFCSRVHNGSIYDEVERLQATVKSQDGALDWYRAKVERLQERR